LIAALNKWWRTVTEYEYLHEMDIPRTQNAITVAGIPEEVTDWIWEKEQKAGLVWT